MNFTVEKTEQYDLLKVVADKLNGVISGELKDLMEESITNGQRNLVLDLSDTKFCDSSGLSAILVGNRRCNQTEGMFVVAGAKDMVMKLITLSQLDKVLTLVPTVSEAHDMIVMSEVEKQLNDEN
ncbi:STAS domain-containing protein [bacterium SCSIO 12741]|nr:STAS domain-containing protein [bacterium SCSIO 12741]